MTDTPDSTPKRRLFLAVGWAGVGLGALGLLLPLLPTTPFLLLAAWAFGRSSPRWRRWLLEHRRLGPPMLAWEEHRVVPVRAKIAALVAIAAGFAWPALAFDWPVWALAATGAILGSVAVWIASRPSRPPAARPVGSRPAAAARPGREPARKDPF